MGAVVKLAEVPPAPGSVMAEKMGGFKLVRHKLELYGLCPKAAGVKNGYCPNESS